ncbi:hypothetical protein ACFRKB_32145 [Streptomyces scopuliridis]|uniref:hypothetical protein n=1 Tax=Streptomyces scopuliridis TaxID=452529 RepID=UPI00367A8E4A
MRKIICLGVALSVPLVMTTAGNAAADSSACTHHFSGPQVCIRLEGTNGWNSVTGIWTNPPKRVKTNAVTLFWNGERYRTATARRVGQSLSYTWKHMETGTNTKLCVRFAASSRTACEKTRYAGIQGSR